MRQAITTKYLGATNTKPSRIKATCDAGSITVSWDYGCGVEVNHEQAALRLAQQLKWNTFGWVGGALPSGKGYVFVDAENY